MKNIIKYVDSLIDIYGNKSSFGSLPDSEQHKLCSMYWDYEDRDIYVLSENENFISCVSNLMNPTMETISESKILLSESLKEAMMECYYTRLDELFYERLSNSEIEHMEECGFNQIVDKENGETIWMR